MLGMVKSSLGIQRPYPHTLYVSTQCGNGINKCHAVLYKYTHPLIGIVLSVQGIYNVALSPKPFGTRGKVCHTKLTGLIVSVRNILCMHVHVHILFIHVHVHIHMHQHIHVPTCPIHLASTCMLAPCGCSVLGLAFPSSLPLQLTC